MIDLKTRLIIALATLLVGGGLAALFYFLGDKESGATFVGLAIAAAVVLGDGLRARRHRESASWYKAHKAKKVRPPPAPSEP